MRFKATLPLPELRDALCARVNAQRDRLLAETMAFEGNTYQVDEASLSDLRAAIADLSAGEPDQWRTADNRMVTMNLATLRRLRKAASARRRAIKRAAMDKKDAILVAADPSMVDIKTGWPA